MIKSGQKRATNYLASSLSDHMIKHTARTGNYVLRTKLISVEELRELSKVNSLVSIVKFKNVNKFLEELGVSINQSSSENLRLRIDVTPGDTLYVISPLDSAGFFRSMSEYGLTIPITTKVEILQYSWVEVKEDSLKSLIKKDG